MEEERQEGIEEKEEEKGERIPAMLEDDQKTQFLRSLLPQQEVMSETSPMSL